jgi:hypothetical protein
MALTPGQEARYALDHGVDRRDLSSEGQAEYDRLRDNGYLLQRQAVPYMPPRPKAAVDGAPGIVTIFDRGWNSLHADDHGLTVRNGPRVRRFAWDEVSHLADGSVYNQGHYDWALLIVLHSGRKVRVHGARSSSTPPVVNHVAARYGIPADVTGVPMKGQRPARRGLYQDPADATGVPMKGQRPARRGLYQDPGGRAGLRYWDSRQWSPLLPPEVSKSRTARLRMVTVPGASSGPASWSALPMAEGRWTYAATAAKLDAVLFAVFAAGSAAFLISGLVTDLSWAGFFFGVLAALAAVRARNDRKFFLKLDEAAKRAFGSSS